ncbi:cupin domain-containing protein [Nocardioides sp. GCM10027113]|uniref:cupin domain-containing protein n=1 Tax=unclassified Nocardioides TaxID=2615069 RepID=UPI00360BCD91
MLEPGTVLDIGDHTVQVLETPRETGDRYRLRIEAEPGGPGIRGSFPHRHPVLVETFTCVRGQVVTRIGRRVDTLPVGGRVEVPTGATHGFLNTGDEAALVDSEVVFVLGYRPEDDLMDFAATYDRMRRRGPVGARTGEPPLLQLAALTHAYRRVMRPPPPAGLLVGPLAGVARLLGTPRPG